MSELKPCPFCGELVYIEKRPLWNGTQIPASEEGEP